MFLFDKVIIPIMNYSSEVWGQKEWPTLEKLHLQDCKYALGVKSSTTPDAIYAELGRTNILAMKHMWAIIEPQLVLRFSLLST